MKEAENEIDKERKQMNKIENEKQIENNQVPTAKKSKYIICPECNENIYISIGDYKISLEDWKNGHKINNILFHEFERIWNK